MGGNMSGARDANAYWSQAAGGFLPMPSAITHEGIYNEHFFEAGEERDEVFRPTAVPAISRDPFSGKPVHYLGIGLNSRLDGDGMRAHGGRPKLNLVFVVDTSGSMASIMPHGKQLRSEAQTLEATEANPDDEANGPRPVSTLAAAKEAVLSVLKHLGPGDRLGLVEYTSTARVVQPLVAYDDLDQNSFRTALMGLRADGGTNLSSGIDTATAMYTEFLGSAAGEADTNLNRLFFMTDMMPNASDNDGAHLFVQTADNAAAGIYSTFIGMGVNFNTDLVELITKNKACNYFTVETTADFARTMDEDFDYTVTPVAFDVDIAVRSHEFEVERVYGSPGFEIPESDTFVHMDSIFPSNRNASGETKGGMMLVRLRPTVADLSSAKILLLTKFVDVDGKAHEGEQEVDMGAFLSHAHESQEAFANGGVRKSVALTRYVDFFKAWTWDEQAGEAAFRDATTEHAVALENAATTGDEVGPPPTLVVRPSVDADVGIPLPPVAGTGVDPTQKTWDNQVRVPLRISEPYRDLISTFTDYFLRETESLADPSMVRRLEEIKKLTSAVDRDVVADECTIL